MKDTLKGFARGRRSKALLFVLLLSTAGLAVATTYAFIYANTAATVRSPDVTLAAGSDASGSCSVYPCATVGISSTSDTATVTLSLFKSDATFTPPPATYYTSLVKINDATNPHSILGIAVSSISSTSASDFGKIAVYYCTVQCTFDYSGAVSGGTLVGSFSITSTTGGVVSGTFPQSISASGTHYIEVVAYAGSTGSAGDLVSFKVSVQWA